MQTNNNHMAQRAQMVMAKLYTKCIQKMFNIYTHTNAHYCNIKKRISKNIYFVYNLI